MLPNINLCLIKQFLVEKEELVSNSTNWEVKVSNLELYKTYFSIIISALKDDKSFENEFKLLSEIFSELIKEDDIETKLLFSEIAIELELRIKNCAYSKRSFQVFIQSMLFSEIKGILNQLSLKKFISRSALGSVGQDAFSLAILDEQKNYRNKFGIVIDRLESVDTDRKIEESKYALIEKENKAIFEFKDFKTGKHKDSIFGKIRTSKYQLQFLEWLINKPKTKQCSLGLSEGFIILERNLTIDINKETETVSYILKDEVKDQNVFVSIPFNIVSNAKESTEFNLPTRIISLDVGEFGIAYSVVDTDLNSNAINVIDSGMISDPQYKRVKAVFTGMKNQNRIGTFTESTTKLAFLRESLIGSLRARLHSLSLKYNAKLIFEFNIDAFETGGNRLQKIYESVKRGSVFREKNKEFEKAVEHYWGTNRTSANEISASFTSQLCSKCCRTANTFNKDQNEIHTITKIEGLDNLYRVINSKSEILNIFSFEEPPARDTKKYDSWWKKSLRESMRPPILEDKDGRVKLPYIIEYYKDESLKDIDPKTLKEKRGNSSLFVCLYDDCRHVTDCDMQASFIIAVKYLLTGSKKEKPKEDYDREFNSFFDKIRSDKFKDKEAWIEATKDLQTRFNFKPIEIDLRNYF